MAVDASRVGRFRATRHWMVWSLMRASQWAWPEPCPRLPRSADHGGFVKIAMAAMV